LKKRLILIAFLILLLGVGTLVYLGQRRRASAEIYYSGTIEATQADLSFQVGGRVQAVPTDEGKQVTAGDCLARLDDAEFQARLEQARAEEARARQNLEQLQAVLELNRAALPAEVDRAKAAVGSLRSQLKELESGYRTQEVEQALLAAQSAKAAVEEARRDKQRYDALFDKRVISGREKDRIDLKYETTLKEYQRAVQAYNMSKEGYRRESIQAARARLAEGVAALKQAESNLKKIDVAAKDVAAANAALAAAGTRVDLARLQLDYTCLKAPFKGTITSRSVEPGEVVSPGRTVFTLADLATVKLKIFVNETDIGRVKPGQPVEVRTDTFPQKTYAGKVSFISPEAEFTPKIIQTHKERVKLVYLVKVTIANPHLELKPGMPADAWLR